MNNTGKFILAVLSASVIAFFGGWLVFGVLFADYYSLHTSEGARFLMREEPALWAIALGNIAWSLLITWVLQKTASTTFSKGFMTGFWVSFLVITVFDMSMYAFWNIYELGFIFTDIMITSVFWAVVGGVAGLVLGIEKKKTVAQV